MLSLKDGNGEKFVSSLSGVEMVNYDGEGSFRCGAGFTVFPCICLWEEVGSICVS